MIVPLIVVVLLGAVVGGAIAYINARFDTINSVSTPPPAIKGSQLGGDEHITIDTGPAQDAVRRAQAGDAQVESPSTAAPAGSDTGAAVAPVTGRSSLMSFRMQEAATPVAAAPATIQMPPRDTGDAILVLLMGVDARPGEAIDVGVRTDTLVVLNLDPDTGSCRLLAIPRDSRVDLPGYGASKINHALAVGGIPYQMLVVEDFLGIHLDHYGLIDFAGVVDLVDELGGITVDNPYAFSYEGRHFSKGKIRLDGDEALSYVRFRGDERGDFGRQDRQQLVVRAMLAEGADLAVVTAIPELLDAVADHVRTDAEPKTLVDLGKEFHSTCTAKTLDAKRIEGRIATFDDPILQQPLSYVVLDKTEVTQKLNWLLTGEEPPAKPEASPVASPVASRRDLAGQTLSRGAA